MKIFTYDCTLRDGEQCEGITLSLEDKLQIVARLDEFGIDYIEGGFPASNPKDIEFFRRVREMHLSHARVAAFGSTCKKETPAAADEGLADLLASGAPVLTVVGKTWDAQVTRALQTTLEENLRMISESVSYLVSAGREVVFDAEHFFDGYAANPAYALACVRAASLAGASSIDLCETNGGALPFRVEAAVSAVAEALPGQQLGIHCHNDSGCAVANTLAAVRAGATQVQGTINGIGERVGNTDLLTVIADLELKMDCVCVGADNLRNLTSLAQFVAETCNMSLSTHHPYTGASAFAHKGGLHASAIARFPEAYEHTRPENVGNTTRMLVSELAGRASLAAKAKTLGFTLDDEATLATILTDVKEREARGYSYEVADGSLAMLIQHHLGTYEPHFTLESFRVIVDDREDTGALAKDAASEATVKIHVGGRRLVATGEGTGPVGALDTALRMAITEFFPQVANMELTDYKVRILDEEGRGTSAVTRVVITTCDGQGSWGTVGVSENIIEASWNALVDSIEYGLMRASVSSPKRGVLQ